MTYLMSKHVAFFRHIKVCSLNIVEICALLGYYAAFIGSFVPTFRDNLSAPSSRDKKMGPIGYPETSVQN
jgi:hypothetical protein